MLQGGGGGGEGDGDGEGVNNMKVVFIIAGEIYKINFVFTKYVSLQRRGGMDREGA